ncbi:MAG: enoyl-CoA hydratase/isomerase family protein, partial [Actinomycetia bacterium]|nr:enoyl-CoA hydratase/isomerase family protein [Actinomycetes bacterium]
MTSLDDYRDSWDHIAVDRTEDGVLRLRMRYQNRPRLWAGGPHRELPELFAAVPAPLHHGLVPGDSLQIIWPLLLGHNRGRHFLLTGQEITTQQAMDLGVVGEVPLAEAHWGRGSPTYPFYIVIAPLGHLALIAPDSLSRMSCGRVDRPPE